MFKRRFPGFGRIRSDEGFTVHYGHKTLYYSDERGTFQIAYEDGLLFPDSLCLALPIREIPQQDKALIIDRMLRSLEWDGHHARVWTEQVGE